jgi:hypothetical protein
MAVIRVAQLILDDQHHAVRLIFPDDVKRITADSALSILELELDAERLSQPISVPRQPRPFC